MEILSQSKSNIIRAATFMKEGGLVAFPTETIYGLGADACNEHAVASIYIAKGRPSFNPLISHVDGLPMAEEIARFDDRASTLAAAFWPGPLTFVLRRSQNCPVSWLACAGLETIAVRCPKHATALALISSLGHPIAAPSANRSGSISPTLATHVAESLGDAVPLILDGGASQVGLESTIIDLTTDTPTLLRPGGLSRENIEALIGAIALSGHAPDAPKSPGQLLRHYAPDTPLRLNAAALGPGEALLAFGPIPEDMKNAAAISLNLSESGDLHEAAANLFSMMRQLDRMGCAGIAAMPVPAHGLGMAINDRLRRAACRDSMLAPGGKKG
ncbi:MAG TPA: threonylcarbamoyl-AMP synthase [Rhodospirillaceae bacterium]|nr:MAG: threonylcarbamoyl-AMP synthase [Alphaproteobacteria bacterium GWF2_58_20]HAU29911.1 threonylcarbamoyl-AMP synthase [Rhodospirillaceae bacterium]